MASHLTATSPTAARGADGDPFTLEVIKSFLLAVGDEMFAAQQRTSMSPIVYEVLDFAAGMTDARGSMITQGNGVTMFLATLSGTVREILRRFEGEIEPGDVFMANDPYQGGGTHLCDVAIVMPVFAEESLVGFVGNKAHWTEVGGKDPGSYTTDATEIYQEGLQLPAVKLYGRDRLNQALVDVLEANVRLPRMTLGDMWSGIAACRVGQRRLVELCDRFGAATVTRAMERILDEADARARAELAKLPHGVFRAEEMIDDDGMGNGPFRVCVRVEISAERFVCDFTGSAPQAQGPINSTASGLEAAARVIYLAVTSPAAPVSDGAFRALEVVCPPGTVFTAERPAPVSVYWESQLFVIDLVWKALAPHLPGRLPAGHFLSVCGTNIAGRDPDSGELYVMVEPQAGGWGAAPGADGQRGQFCVADGETFVIPLEIAEARYPVRARRYEFHAEPGGAGRWRGGNGVVREFEILSDDGWVTATLGRHRYPPWGLAGGRDGTTNRIEILSGEGDVLDRRGKTARHPLANGQVLRLVTGTGGGYGSPRDRPLASVAADVADGYITAAEAREAYGVVVDDRTLEVRSLER
jgi:N-methylhydantoinase B